MISLFCCHKSCRKTFMVQSSHLINSIGDHLSTRTALKYWKAKGHIRHLYKHPFIVWIMFLFCGNRCKYKMEQCYCNRNITWRTHHQDVQMTDIPSQVRKVRSITSSITSSDTFTVLKCDRRCFPAKDLLH